MTETHDPGSIRERLLDMAQSAEGGVNTGDLVGLLREAAAALSLPDDVGWMRESDFWERKVHALEKRVKELEGAALSPPPTRAEDTKTEDSTRSLGPDEGPTHIHAAKDRS
jgi:hypothetical protein